MWLKKFRELSNAKGVLNVKTVHYLKIFNRKLWGYVAIAFNRVDTDRLIRVGPNRLCAEWLLKNGGAVRLTSNPNILWKDYNSLPPENKKFHIKVADGSNSSIMKIGLAHFAGCEHVDTVIFHNCKYLEAGSLSGLVHLEKSLTNLQISKCDDINDEDLKSIRNLKNLQSLKISKMINVKNVENLRKLLETELPKCHIQIE